MSVSIRLTRTGKKNYPSYRIVAVKSRSKRDGKNLEVLGFYNPSNTPVLFEYDKARTDEWIKQGAVMSEAVAKLIKGDYVYQKYDPKKEKAEQP